MVFGKAEAVRYNDSAVIAQVLQLVWICSLAGEKQTG
jgi:hypothetical protein